MGSGSVNTVEDWVERALADAPPVSEAVMARYDRIATAGARRAARETGHTSASRQAA